MIGKKGQESNLAFVGKLIIAAFSLIIIVFVGLTFVSVLLPVKLDPHERLEVFERVLSQSLGDEDVKFLSFDLNKDEFMIIFTKNPSREVCGSNEWKLEEEKNLAICIGKKDHELLYENAVCKQFQLAFEDDENVERVLIIVDTLRPLYREKKISISEMIGRLERQGAQVACIEPSSLQTYHLELIRDASNNDIRINLR